ncbi:MULTISPECIES: twin-arginine translocation signal domain-containing protein [Halorussus]|uniref:twin-arginine translocation signal domain-containing protein n=1 Tax=Halorussus TaxID=1070314 RepID=UPI000E2126AD|nr:MULTISPECIES: twin-arginine translocation signal domain-containing protein [Halorussus]NHN59213.1 twin-arginine translocation signal domain-containing protein [Halorussus sp. JP-T4]
MTQKSSRRRFLKAAAATGALAGLNATVLAQGQNEEVILLGGYTRAWEGYRLPGGESASGSSNPTLTLQEGTTYTLMWQNGDGVGHNFAIQDSQGNNLEVLEPLSVQPDTFQQINETSANQSVSLQVSGGNVTGVSTGNQTGGGGNATGGQQSTESLIASTEIISEQGAVQAVRFTATPEMAQYICLVHPNTMVGDVQVQGGGGGGGGNNSSM